MRLTINLVTADDDLSPQDPAIQAEFKSFSSKLSAADIKYSQRGIAFDGGGALGYPLGQFILDFTTAITPVLKAAIAAWLISRKGRKASMTLDGEKIEAGSADDLLKLLDKYESIRKGRPPQLGNDSSNTDSSKGR